MPGYDETQITDLLRLLPPAPEHWVAEARRLPETRSEIDRLLSAIEDEAEGAETGDLEVVLHGMEEGEEPDVARPREDSESAGRLVDNEPEEGDMSDEREMEKRRHAGAEDDEDVEGHVHESEKHIGPKHIGPKSSDLDEDSDEDVEGHMHESEKHIGPKHIGPKSSDLDEDSDEDL